MIPDQPASSGLRVLHPMRSDDLQLRCGDANDGATRLLQESAGPDQDRILVDTTLPIIIYHALCRKNSYSTAPLLSAAPHF